jgi:dihydrolipoamide dehydrogenase
MRIIYSSPNICIAGMPHRELTEKGIDFVAGEAGYEHQGRAMIMGERPSSGPGHCRVHWNIKR